MVEKEFGMYAPRPRENALGSNVPRPSRPRRITGRTGAEEERKHDGFQARGGMHREMVMVVAEKHGEGARDARDGTRGSITAMVTTKGTLLEAFGPSLDCSGDQLQ